MYYNNLWGWYASAIDSNTKTAIILSNNKFSLYCVPPTTQGKRERLREIKVITLIKGRRKNYHTWLWTLWADYFKRNGGQHSGGFQVGWEKVVLSHLQFANNMIFFCFSKEESFLNLNQIYRFLKLFRVSGLIINCQISGLNCDSLKLHH